MTREEAVEELQDIKSVYENRELGELRLMRSEVLALEMAIKALSQQPCDDAEQIDYHDDFATALKKINDYEMTRNERAAISILNAYKEGYESAIEDYKQEPCDVSVSEKEPNEITEEVTLRFFKNSLKVRWHDFVIYNVEWLKKNWQMEMEIVCGVKPCDDAISREAVLDLLATRVPNPYYENVFRAVGELTPVTQKSGKWNEYYTSQKGNDVFNCKECGHTFVVMQGKDNMNYCPNCGAKMESEE